jgi:hypothetical protein
MNILEDAHKLKCNLEYEFLATVGIGKNKPLNESATANAIRRLGDPSTNKSFGTEFMKSHGFRHPITCS